MPKFILRGQIRTAQGCEKFTLDIRYAYGQRTVGEQAEAILANADFHLTRIATHAPADAQARQLGNKLGEIKDITYIVNPIRGKVFGIDATDWPIEIGVGGERIAQILERRTNKKDLIIIIR